MSVNADQLWSFMVAMKSAPPTAPLTEEELALSRQKRDAEDTAREMTQRLQWARYTSVSALSISPFTRSHIFRRHIQTDQESVSTAEAKVSESSGLARLASQVHRQMGALQELSRVWQKLSNAVKSESEDLSTLLEADFPKASYDLSQWQRLSTVMRGVLIETLDGRAQYVNSEIAELERLSEDIATYERDKLESEGWVICIR